MNIYLREDIESYIHKYWLNIHKNKFALSKKEIDDEALRILADKCDEKVSENFVTHPGMIHMRQVMDPLYNGECHSAMWDTPVERLQRIYPSLNALQKSKVLYCMNYHLVRYGWEEPFYWDVEHFVDNVDHILPIIMRDFIN